MKLSSILAACTFGLSASAIRVSWDAGYDDPNRSLTTLACSDGANGLMTKYGWTTQGQIWRFPMIGGAYTIAGWNSDQCGTCYSLTYKGNTIYILAVDHAGSGFNIGKTAMNRLTNNKADMFGAVDAKATKVALARCKA